VTPAGIVYALLLAALIVLSLRSIIVLRGTSPWTSVGWAATVGYSLAELAEIVRGTHLAYNLPYWYLAALTAAFVVAGVRDEAQSEPWWWPRGPGPTRAERRGR
jgi:hypothetical protein